MYCRRCAYNLKQLDTHRCPECGRPFDPTNPKTFRRHPSSRTRNIKHIALVTLALIVFLTIISFLHIWPATSRINAWHTTFWQSDYFVIYD